jgi:hypothetical protein
MPRISLLLLSLCLAGCQINPYTFGPEPAPTDWYQAGQDDAMAGYTIQNDEGLGYRHGDHHVDRQEWLRGYAKGQSRICNNDYLQLAGESGKRFPPGCENLSNSPALKASWQKASDAGLRASILN